MGRKVEAYGNVIGTDSVRVYTETTTTAKTGAGNLDTIVVAKGGDRCTMTVYDDTTVLHESVLNDESTYIGKTCKPYTLDFASLPFDTSLKVKLHSAAAVIHYKLNALSGTTATDSGSYASNGTLVNMANEDWVQGIKLNGLAFDGADDRITCGNGSKAFDCYSPWSVVCWYYTTDITRPAVLFSNYTTKQTYCGMNQEGTFFVRIGGSTSGQIRPTTVDVLPESTWFHLAATYNGSGDASGIRVYINGVEYDMAPTVASDLTGTTKISQEIYIGCHPSGATPMAAIIDDFRLYQEELSQEEIKLLYNNGIGTEEDFALGDVSVTFN